MHRLTTAAAIAVSALAVSAVPAAAAPDNTLELAAAEGSTAAVTGKAANGANVSFFVNQGPLTGTCGKDLQTMCESTLVKVEQRLGTATDKNVKIRLDGFTAASDFDLRVYDSTATGTLGNNLGSPRGDSADGSPLDTDDPRHTGPGDFERKIVKPKSRLTTTPDDVKTYSYYLVYVPYFLTANDKYKLSVAWTKDAAF